MLKHTLALIVAISFTTALHAQGDTDRPLAYYVDRASYGLHLKVAETSDGAAICEYKSVLLGFVITDEHGRLRVLADDLEKGDEFVLFSAEVEIGGEYGMTFDAGDAKTVVIPGELKADVRKAVQARFDDAEALLFALEEHLPDARDEAEKALNEIEGRRREDLKELSPEADLLVDLVAAARAAPDLADVERPALTDQQRRRLTGIALKAVCGLHGDAVETARKLVGGRGNGVCELLLPSTLDVSAALPHLRELSEDGLMEPLLARLLRFDTDSRARAWAAELATGEGDARRNAEWVLIDAAEKHNGRQWLKDALSPDRGDDYPWESADERVTARLVDADAWHLYSYLSPSRDLPSGGGELQQTRTTAVAQLDDRVEFLSVYAYLLAVRGGDDESVKSMRKDLTEFADSRSPKLHLGDLRELRGAILQEGGDISQTLRMALRRR